MWQYTIQRTRSSLNLSIESFQKKVLEAAASFCWSSTDFCTELLRLIPVWTSIWCFCSRWVLALEVPLITNNSCLYFPIVHSWQKYTAFLSLLRMYWRPYFQICDEHRRDPLFAIIDRFTYVIPSWTNSSGASSYWAGAEKGVEVRDVVEAGDVGTGDGVRDVDANIAANRRGDSAAGYMTTTTDNYFRRSLYIIPGNYSFLCSLTHDKCPFFIE